MIDPPLLRSALDAATNAARRTSDPESNQTAFTLSQPLGRSGCRVGVAHTSRVVLAVPPIATYGVSLQRLEYLPSAVLQFTDSTGELWEETSGYIACEVVTDAEEHVMLGIYAYLVNELDRGADPTIVGHEVTALRSLFSALTTASQREEIGLWGELFVIAESQDPVALAAAWGRDPQRVFDFAVDRDRLEIKTTTKPARDHIFSLSQLRQAAQSTTAVVSILTTEVGAGTTVLDLLRRTEQRLMYRTDLAQAVLHRTVQVAGTALNSPRCFDEHQARSTMLVLPFSSVPSPTVPPEILDLTWTARLTHEVAHAEPSALVDALDIHT